LKAVIFLGPSLPLAEAREILDAVYLPPAQQCDLLNATVNEKPDVIGLIDGMFLQSLSVWHKEILYALDQGILIYGSSSMGALRAAETSSFGMVGVGEIYRMYASGELIDDDEVALAHASAEQQYKKVSEPMVNVRATFQAAQAAGIINANQLARLLEIAKPIYFAERTFWAIFEAAAKHLPKPVIEALALFVDNSYVDLKRQDAIELLQTIKRLTASERTGRKRNGSFTFKRSTAFETLHNRDRQVPQNGIDLHLESISNYVALYNPNFDDLNFNALNRIVVLAFAEMLGLEVEENALEAECTRFRKRKKLTEDADFTSWLTANHLGMEDFRGLMSQVVLCRRLHRWFMIAMWMERTSKIILDELRLHDQYPEWAARAATHERLLASSPNLDMSSISFRDLVSEHSEWSDCSFDIDPLEWAEEAGFHTMGNLKMELTRGSRARHVLLELLANSTTGEDDGETLPEDAAEPSGRSSSVHD
jgi:hypothetical protein